MGDVMQTSKPQATPVRLANADMVSLWQAATGALLHGPRCTCVGFGMMYRSSTELERDIVEFLIVKYEDRRNDVMVCLFQRWIDERTSLVRAGGAPPGAREGLLQWIDRNTSSMGIPPDDVREIAADIRTLLRSMATPTGGFTCS